MSLDSHQIEPPLQWPLLDSTFKKTLLKSGESPSDYNLSPPVPKKSESDKKRKNATDSEEEDEASELLDLLGKVMEAALLKKLQDAIQAGTISSAITP